MILEDKHCSLELSASEEMFYHIEYNAAIEHFLFFLIYFFF